ncbi:MAG TPA: LytR C-terminal domain-containing protein [Mycobacteriales bacterium]
MLVIALVALIGPSHHTTSAGGPTASPRQSAAGVGGSGPSSRAAKTRASGSTQTPTPAPTHHRRSTPSTPPAGSAREPLVVLNNTTITGLADRASAEFTAAGWTVTSFGNYENDILSTCAYFDPSAPGAQAAAEELAHQFPTIKRVKAQFRELAAYHSPIVVILTPDFVAP